MAITPFKVTDFDTSRKPICDFLLATVARSSAVGPSLLPVRWPGTHCLTASEIRLC